MSAIELFQNDDFQVRSMLIDGEPWFVAADICRALGLGNATMALTKLDDDDLNSIEVIDSMGRTQQARTVNEAGMYLLVMRSDKAEAVRFRKWIASEVLPAIRKTGTYSLTPAPVAVMPTHSEALRGWAEALDENARKDRVIEQITPAAQAWDQFLNSDHDYSVREAAQILCRDKAIRTGEGRLFSYLRGARWIDSNNEPMQVHINAKRVVRKADFKRNHKTGWEGETSQVRITPKGLGDLHKLLGGQQSLNTLVWPELGLRAVGS
jgi:anti-repressor protein